MDQRSPWPGPRGAAVARLGLLAGLILLGAAGVAAAGPRPGPVPPGALPAPRATQPVTPTPATPGPSPTPLPPCAAVWTLVAGPDGSGASSALDAVAGTGPNDVWAVGNTGDTPQAARTLILHWNGTAWTVVPSPNPAPATTCCTAWPPWRPITPGPSARCRTPARPLILHWDGTAWHDVVAPAARTTS